LRKFGTKQRRDSKTTADYRLSCEAEHDLEGIYYIGFIDFGPLQADAYHDGLVERFQHGISGQASFARRKQAPQTSICF
jgi:plasmid stabilization system protein ParE